MSTTSPYRTGAEPVRPRLWVPGRIFASDDGLLTVGAHAGLGEGSGIDQWKTTVHVVERAALAPGVVDALGLVLPERHVDPARAPHVHRWLCDQPLVCVREAEIAALVERGVRVYTVGYHRVSDGLLVEALGGGAPARSLGCVIHGLVYAACRPGLDGAIDDDAYDAARDGMLDRLHRAAGGSALHEVAVESALAARALVQPGYAWDHAPVRGLASSAAIHEEARFLEATWRQVYARADAMRAEADQVVEALEAAPPEAAAVALPFYGNGRAWREIAPELRVQLGTGAGLDEGALLVDGVAQSEIVLPAEVRWRVEGTDAWRPELPPELAEARAAQHRRLGRAASFPFRGMALLALVIAALIALVVIRLG